MSKEATPTVTLYGKTYTPDMNEISGFGGSYEEACRSAVEVIYAKLAPQL